MFQIMAAIKVAMALPLLHTTDKINGLAGQINAIKEMSLTQTNVRTSTTTYHYSEHWRTPPQCSESSLSLPSTIPPNWYLSLEYAPLD